VKYADTEAETSVT